MKLTKKQFRIADFAIVIFTLFALILAFGYVQPMLLYPINNYETTNMSVLFSFKKGGTIFLDDNIDFSSPEKIDAKDNLIINLKPGTYYWKVQGVVNSEIRSLTIKSLVDLELKDAGDSYQVVNAGNTRLNVSVYNKSVLTGSIVLDRAETRNASGTNFVGREQYD